MVPGPWGNAKNRARHGGCARDHDRLARARPVAGVPLPRCQRRRRCRRRRRPASRIRPSSDRPGAARARARAVRPASRTASSAPGGSAPAPSGGRAPSAPAPAPSRQSPARRERWTFEWGCGSASVGGGSASRGGGQATARRRRAGGLGHESWGRGRSHDAGAEARDRAHRSARAEGRDPVRGLPRGPACSPAPGTAPARGDRAAAPGVADCGRPAAGPRGGAGAPRGAAGRPGASARGPRGLRGRVRRDPMAIVPIAAGDGA